MNSLPMKLEEANKILCRYSTLLPYEISRMTPEQRINEATVVLVDMEDDRSFNRLTYA
jgi:hypothetical protein